MQGMKVEVVAQSPSAIGLWWIKAVPNSYDESPIINVSGFSYKAKYVVSPEEVEKPTSVSISIKGESWDSEDWSTKKTASIVLESTIVNTTTGEMESTLNPLSATETGDWISITYDLDADYYERMRFTVTVTGILSSSTHDAAVSGTVELKIEKQVKTSSFGEWASFSGFPKTDSIAISASTDSNYDPRP